MPLKNQHPYEWPPQGLSDSEDSTHAFRGAMTALQDMIPSPNTAATWVCRPAAQQISAVTNKAVCFLTVGNILYGMRHSLTFAGKDEPFAFNLSTLTYLTISGVASANLPTAQADTGDWTPPTAAQVGSRIIFTHPGFAGSTSNATYYNADNANTYSGQTRLDGLDAATFSFIQVGQRLFGTNIPANTTVTAVSLPNVNTTASGTSGTPTITVASATGIVLGQAALAGGIPAGTTVSNIVGLTITLSANLTNNLSATPILFTGSLVTMSNAATGSGATVLEILSSSSNKIGWLDISNLSLTTLATTENGVPGLFGAPLIGGVQPGMTVTGSGIAVGTTVQGAVPVAVTGNYSFSGGSNQITQLSVNENAEPMPGMSVVGPGIPLGTTILQISRIAGMADVYTLSQNTTGAGPANLTFSGNLVVLSLNATASAIGTTVTFTGGTSTNPQWGAGDSNVTPFAAVPVFVRQFSGRGYYGVNTTNPTSSAVQLSDPGIPCQTSSPTQVITFNDGIPVTAAAGLPLNNQLGGIIQSLMVFQGAANIRQITGDPTSNNLSVNSLQTATGTLSPNSIATTPDGLLFAAPDGARLIDFNARISEPIGLRGQGIVKPFINVVTPTRTAAAYNENVYRISISWQPQAGGVFGAARRDEFWFHLDLKKWSGPHSFVSDLLAPWQSQGSFVASDTSGLWQSDVAQSPASVFVEKGQQMTWTWTTGLLPDNPDQVATAVNESSIFFSMPNNDQALATAVDDQGAILGQAYVWVGPGTPIAQAPIDWNNTLTFRQMSVSLTGNASAQVRIGTLNLRYQRLGYQLPRAPARPFVLGRSILGGPDVLAPGP